MNSVWTTPHATYPSEQIVGQLLPNQFNLYDMHGNVEEYCHDGWLDGYSYGSLN